MDGDDQITCISGEHYDSPLAIDDPDDLDLAPRRDGYPAVIGREEVDDLQL